MANFFSNIFGGGDVGSSTVNLYKNLKVPTVDQVRDKLDEYVLQGLISPQLAETILQQSSAFNDVNVDPSTRAAQLSALDQLQGIAGAEGLDAQTLADLYEVQGEERQQEQGARGALMDRYRAMGAGGSGVELASLLANQQGAAQRSAQRGFQTAALGAQRKLDALTQAAELGGSIRSADTEQANKVAQANDIITNFNAQNRQSVVNANLDRVNTAQEGNLQNRQAVSDANVTQRNQYLPQDVFQGELQKKAGIASGYQARDAAKQAGAARFTDFVGNSIKGAATASASDERVKEDVQPFDASDALSKITGFSYKYRDPEEHGQGPQTGVMAQDIAKSGFAPQAVHPDEQGVLRVDTEKLAMPMLAALSDIEKRLGQLEGRR